MADHPMVVIYTSKVCPECKALKQFLQDNKIEHRDRNIDADYDAREHMNNILKASNKIPVVVIGEKIFVGFQRNMKNIKKELSIK